MGAQTRGVNNQRFEVSCEVELKSTAVTKWESRMSLRQYFELFLPDPRRLLFEALHSAGIAPLCSRTCIYQKMFHINWKYFRMVTPSEIYSTQNIFNQNLKVEVVLPGSSSTSTTPFR